MLNGIIPILVFSKFSSFLLSVVIFDRMMYYKSMMEITHAVQAAAGAKKDEEVNATNTFPKDLENAKKTILANQGIITGLKKKYNEAIGLNTTLHEKYEEIVTLLVQENDKNIASLNETIVEQDRQLEELKETSAGIGLLKKAAEDLSQERSLEIARLHSLLLSNEQESQNRYNKLMKTIRECNATLAALQAKTNESRSSNEKLRDDLSAMESKHDNLQKELSTAAENRHAKLMETLRERNATLAASKKYNVVLTTILVGFVVVAFVQGQIHGGIWLAAKFKITSLLSQVIPLLPDWIKKILHSTMDDRSQDSPTVADNRESTSSSSSYVFVGLPIICGVSILTKWMRNESSGSGTENKNNQQESNLSVFAKENKATLLPNKKDCDDHYVLPKTKDTVEPSILRSGYTKGELQIEKTRRRMRKEKETSDDSDSVGSKSGNVL